MDLRGVATPGTHSPALGSSLTLGFARAGGPPCGGVVAWGVRAGLPVTGPGGGVTA
jgi:hypothetical protein